MASTNKTKKSSAIHFPRLDTILMVEKVLRDARDEEPLSKNEIDRRLKTKVMRPTLNLILNYLEENGKITQSRDGIYWIYLKDASPKLKKMIKEGVLHSTSVIDLDKVRKIELSRPRKKFRL
jgi:DNA-binding transcriptional ArsR family regulator